MAVLKENRALKKKVSQLKRQLDESELKRSYMVNPNAIGYRNDMGW
nr:MAG TPA: A-type inclusion protein repeat protein [Caudoviricetes sp.]